MQTLHRAGRLAGGFKQRTVLLLGNSASQNGHNPLLLSTPSVTFTVRPVSALLCLHRY